MGKEKLILGISASPRKDANTDILMKIALEEAGQADNIKTELLYLRDYKIEYCKGCFACCKEGAANMDRPCPIYKDDMGFLADKLLECSALFIGCPVYFGTVPGQLKAFMDRTEGLLRYSTSKYKYGLSNKIGAGLVVGGNRNGGEEMTLLALYHYYMIHNMIVIGTGPDRTPGCYLGACATTYPQSGQVSDAVLQDQLGIKSAKMAGRRLAEVLNMMKD